MIVYLVFIAFCFLVHHTKVLQKDALLITCFILFIVMGFRENTIGTDTYRYCKYYLSNTNYSMAELLTISTNYGYHIFVKLLSFIAPDSYWFFLTVVSAITTISIYHFLKRYSCNTHLSIIMLLSLSFIFFYMTGIKQTLAMSVLLYAYTALLNKKTLQFILLVFIAASFHNSSLIFLMAYFVIKIPFNKYIAIILPIASLISYLYGNIIFSFARSLLGSNFYSQYGDSYLSSNNLTGLFIQLTIYIVSVIILYKKINSHREIKILFLLYGVGMFFQGMTGIVAEFFRLSMYFSIFGIILLPCALKNISDKMTSITAHAACGLVFVLYFALFHANNPAYSPYHLCF